MWEKQPVYLHSMLAASLPSSSLRSNNDNSLSALGSRPTQVQELFTLVLRLFGTTSHCLSVQPFQLLPLRNIWKHISLTWPFLHRHWHVRWPVDVMELFLWLCCWTLNRLLCHWAWLYRGYWRYRSLIDWLIITLDWELCVFICQLPFLGIKCFQSLLSKCVKRLLLRGNIHLIYILYIIISIRPVNAPWMTDGWTSQTPLHESVVRNYIDSYSTKMSPASSVVSLRVITPLIFSPHNKIFQESTPPLMWPL